MSIAAAVNQTIDRAPTGQIFGYEVFPQYREAPGAVVRAVNRGVESRRLKRVAKGRFYKPRTGVLGDVPISDEERLRDALYRNGRRSGTSRDRLYKPGPLPRSRPIRIAVNRGNQTKDFAHTIKLVSRRAPISGLRCRAGVAGRVRRRAKLPGATVDSFFTTMARRLSEFIRPPKKVSRARVGPYNSGTRDRLGTAPHACGRRSPELRMVAQPTTRFRPGDRSTWAGIPSWGIR